MKKVKLLNAECTLGKNGDIVEMYDLDDLKKYCNISKNELKGCNSIKDLYKAVGMNIAGFVKNQDYTSDKPQFVQVVRSDIEFID